MRTEKEGTMKFKPNWLQPGTIVDASDRKYIVTPAGWRVYEYKENSSAWKTLSRIQRG